MRRFRTKLSSRELIRLLYYDSPLEVGERNALWMNSDGIKSLYIEGYYERCLSAFRAAVSGGGDAGIAQLRVHVDQIERDLHRIGTNYAEAVDTVKLRNICHAMCAHDTETGYTQSMNILGAKLLTMLGDNEHDAFWAFVFIASFGYTSSFNHRDRFQASSLMADVRLVEGMLDRWPMAGDGSLLGLVRRLKLDRNLYGTVPLSMLLSQNGGGFNIGRHDSDKLWDYMFCTSNHFVILSAIVAIIASCAPLIAKDCDSTDATQILHCSPICLSRSVANPPTVLAVRAAANSTRSYSNASMACTLSGIQRESQYALGTSCETLNATSNERQSHTEDQSAEILIDERNDTSNTIVLQSFASMLRRVLRSMTAEQQVHLDRHKAVLLDERRRMERLNSRYTVA